MTELLAGLLVASLLIVGISQLTWRYASSSHRVRAEAASIQDLRMIQAMFADVARVDPGSLNVGPANLDARINGEPLAARLREEDGGRWRLDWRSPRMTRTINVPDGVRFEQAPDGLILLRAAPGEPPLATAIPRRSIGADCQFDTVIRECRQ